VSTILTILLSARDAGNFSDAAGEQEMAPKCGSLPRDAGDLAGLQKGHKKGYDTAVAPVLPIC